MAASASASSSSPQVLCGKYDVFISFRGTDVRFGFLHHLERALRRKLIDVYVDDRLEGGDEISPTLMKAIERSMIALVIFSKDYASSRWCLEELVKIVEFKEAGKQIVIPVFYLVEPSDVRHQKGTYAEAFTLHEGKFKVSLDNLQIWRSVLTKSANLSGHPSSAFPNESALIEAIVEDVLKKLEDNSPTMQESHLIGFHQNFTSVESLMEIELQEVRILGIWGMGGIGKTTLAQAIFDKFLSKFESRCFLKNVREKATKVDGLYSLHRELISELFNIKDHIDMEFARRRLKGKKVLIVLDDVNDSEQLEVLVGQRLLWGLGSRIIVTSRDKHILSSGEILDKYIHEVKALHFEESLELFCRHAFNQSHPKEGYQQLSQETVDIAKGIPLALKVLGSHFHSRDPAYWESELRKLKRYPNKKIQNILKISYDGLHPMDKEIFLDIAFFFVGDKKDNVTCHLVACGFNAVSGIQNLIDKALIKFDWVGHIVMHDLIQEMAYQIVCEERMRRPEKHSSRLKDVEEIYDVLKSNKEMDEIEGIILDMSQIEYVQVESDTFVKMKNLRFLKFFYSTVWMPHGGTYVDLLSDLDSFSNKLRYLHWDHYPSEALPSGSYIENLVELQMKDSNVKRLWDGKLDLGNLKTINLSGSKQLIELPDFSMAHKLQSVDVQGCASLRSLHPSILSLPNIIDINVSRCSKLESIESETHLESLSYLGADDCCLKKLFLSSKKLSQLYLQRIEVEILHFPIGRCTELTEIRIEDGRVGSMSIDELRCLTNLEVFLVPNLKQVVDIKQLHSLFDAWPNLRSLCLDGWSYLSKIPDNIKALTRLAWLSLEGSAVETLPAYFTDLSSLMHINLRGCKRIKSILGLPPFLRMLIADECTLLETVSVDSSFRNHCDFYFCDCEKLDERSIRCIQESILSPMSSGFMACYPGSRVPECMKYKPMTQAVNATKLTGDLERSGYLLFCCVLPKQLDVSCSYHAITLSFGELNRDHVLLWHWRRRPWDTCEFFLDYRDEEGKYCHLSAKECQALLLYYSEPVI